MTNQLNNIFEPIEEIYMLSHSIGRMPLSAPAILKQQLLDPWSSNRSNIWESWDESIKGFKHNLAKLFNVKTEEFCHQTNISSGLTKILNALPAPNPILLSLIFTISNMLAIVQDFREAHLV